jgi:hypothetical protein
MKPFRVPHSATPDIRWQLLLPALLAASLAQAQISGRGDVPVAVRNAFELRFPGARKAGWSLYAEYEYAASFVWKKEPAWVRFRANGNWVETRRHLPADSVPAAVADSVHHRFGQEKKIRFRRRETPAGKSWLLTGSWERMPEFSDQGRLLGSVEEEDQ